MYSLHHHIFIKDAYPTGNHFVILLPVVYNNMTIYVCVPGMLCLNNFCITNSGYFGFRGTLAYIPSLDL